MANLLLTLRCAGFWLLLAGLLGAGHGSRASHLLGGELTYRYLDGNGASARPFRYEVTVSIYINADTLSGPPTQSEVPHGRTAMWVAFYYKGGARDGDSLSVALLPRVTKRFATPRALPGCPATSPVRLTVYRDTVELPMSAGGYYAYVSDGRRNANINNIEYYPLRTSDEENMTLYTDMAPPTIPNASPTFSDTAVVLICSGDTTLLINSANDVDGDRLTYTFGVPYSASPALTNSMRSSPRRFAPPPLTVQYGPGYSLAQPFGGGPGVIVRLDASTGLSTYRILTQGRYVVAVDVDEYRTINGQSVLIGRTRRDIQLVVRVCPAGAVPAINSPVVTPRSYVIEEGQPLAFPIAATVSAAQAPLTVRVNSALLDGAGGFDATFGNNAGTLAPGASTGIVSVQGPGAVAASFVFNSRCGTARPSPYDVLVTATSQDCRRQTDVAIYRVTVTRPAAPTIVGDSLICDPAVLQTYAAQGPVRASYRWRLTGGTFVGPSTGRIVQVRWPTAPGMGQLSVRGVSAYGCLTDSVLHPVAVQPGGSGLAVSGALTICAGRSTTLTVSGGVGGYTLTGGGQTLSGPGPFVLSPTATTTYSIAALTAGGCRSQGTATVVVEAAPQLSVSGATTICPGAAATLTVTGGAGSYTLSGGGQTLSSPGTFTLSPATTTTYTIAGNSAGGCPATATAVVSVRAAGALSLSSPPDICPGSSATLIPAGGAGSYTLSGGGQTLAGPGPFTLSPAATTTYTLSGTTADGCPAQPATATVVVLPQAGACTPPDRTLVFPNIITPNGDGLNEVFEIKNLAFSAGGSLAVFNRWGKEVYSEASYRNSWGNAPGVAPGLYYYIFRLQGGATTKGWLEVVR